MSRNVRLVLTAVAVLLGLVLIIGGIDASKNGAVVIGIIVAGVAARQFIAGWKSGGEREKKG
ncbi:MAG: hypothetical protein M5R41_07780 [Bacteroidia bacterium]|nr:hypothetical protein [Bacteroidia bacterium]